ncbi:MAG: beta-lactamase family protein, partial [Candidatus Krumholzibacteria bacterium]|nr:beta-lactamase family protein [Candidatus Krumholzibacteria bacterium]
MSRSFRYHRISAGLIILLLGVLACSKAVTDSQDIPESPPVTGIGLESFDRIITGIMGEYAIPGGSLAVVKDSRLVVARGYGYSDVDAGEPVQPESLFRICSITKPITAVTVMKLVEEGLLDLDSTAFPYLDHLSGPPGTTPDPRLATITIRQLLNHSGGWDREESFDPMFISVTAAQAMGETPLADAETVIRYMLGQPLDFDPGTRYAYSNFGYNVLGRIIEQVTSREYEEYVKECVLAPAGITRMQKGRTLLEDRTEGEVLYYHYPGAGLASSVFPELPGEVLWPYGGFHLEAMDSHGAWIGSAIDLVRFATAVDLHASRP